MKIIRKKGVTEVRMGGKQKPIQKRSLIFFFMTLQLLDPISNPLGFVGMEAALFLEKGANPILVVVRRARPF